jgi:hypothetical protein
MQYLELVLRRCRFCRGRWTGRGQYGVVCATGVWVGMQSASYRWWR